MAVQTAAFLVALAFGYLVFIAIYRLYFHPLAAIPGPFWARLTTLPSYWHTLQQDRHAWLLQLQQEYGQYTLLFVLDVSFMIFLYPSNLPINLRSV